MRVAGSPPPSGRTFSRVFSALFVAILLAGAGVLLDSNLSSFRIRSDPLSPADSLEWAFGFLLAASPFLAAFLAARRGALGWAGLLSWCGSVCAFGASIFSLFQVLADTDLSGSTTSSPSVPDEIGGIAGLCAVLLLFLCSFIGFLMGVAAAGTSRSRKRT